MVTPTDELCDSIKIATYILNNTKDVEVATHCWVSVVDVFENKTKRMLWLQMSKPTQLPWRSKQEDKMN